MKALAIVVLLTLGASVSHAYSLECVPVKKQAFPNNATIEIKPTSLQSAVVVVQRVKNGKTLERRYEAVSFFDGKSYAWVHDSMELELVGKSKDGRLWGTLSTEYGTQNIVCAYK